MVMILQRWIPTYMHSSLYNMQAFRKDMAIGHVIARLDQFHASVPIYSNLLLHQSIYFG